MRESHIRLSASSDLGSGATCMWVWRRPLDWPDGRSWSPERHGHFPDDVYGLVISHRPFEADHLCTTMVFVKEPYDGTSGSVWKVLEWEPLTLEKAIECPKCHTLGMIENGLWKLA